MNNYLKSFLLLDAITSKEDLAKVYDGFKDYFHQATAIGSTTSSWGGDIMVFVYNLTKTIEGVYTKTFDLIGFTTNDQLNALQIWFRNIGFAIMLLSMVYIGLSYITGKEMKWTHIVKQVCVSTMGIVLVPYVLGVSGDFVKSSYSEISSAGSGTELKSDSIAFSPIKNNVVDLYALDHDGFKEKVQDMGSINKITQSNLPLVDFGELIDKDRSKKMENPKVFQNYLHLDFNKDKNSYSKEIEALDSHLFLKNLNSYYLRYSGSKLIIILQLLIVSVILITCAIKVVKLVFQLVIYGVINPAIALSDIRGGKRYKQLINTIVGTIISIIMTMAVIKVFTIFLGVINNIDLSSMPLLGRGIFNIIAYLGAFFATFSGVGFIERITGVENGFSNESANAFALYEGSKLLANAGKGVFNMATSGEKHNSSPNSSLTTAGNTNSNSSSNDNSFSSSSTGGGSGANNGSEGISSYSSSNTQSSNDKNEENGLSAYDSNSNNDSTANNNNTHEGNEGSSTSQDNSNENSNSNDSAQSTNSNDSIDSNSKEDVTNDVNEDNNLQNDSTEDHSDYDVTNPDETTISDGDKDTSDYDLPESNYPDNQESVDNGNFESYENDSLDSNSNDQGIDDGIQESYEKDAGAGIEGDRNDEFTNTEDNQDDKNNFYGQPASQDQSPQNENTESESQALYGDSNVSGTEQSLRQDDQLQNEYGGDSAGSGNDLANDSNGMQDQNYNKYNKDSSSETPTANDYYSNVNSGDTQNENVDDSNYYKSSINSEPNQNKDSIEGKQAQSNNGQNGSKSSEHYGSASAFNQYLRQGSNPVDKMDVMTNDEDEEI